MNSITVIKIISAFVLRTLSTLLLHALPRFILSGTKRNVWRAVVGLDLPKLVDKRKKACFLGKRHSLEATCSVYISRGIQLPEGQEHSDIKFTRTEHQLHMNGHINAASL